MCKIRRVRKYEECHKIIDDVEYKQCNSCDEWFLCNDEYFYKVKNKTDGLRPDCKNCTKKNSKKWQENNPERYRESFKRKNKKHSKEYYSRYKKNWRKEKAVHIRDYEREWQENNKDKIKRYNDYRRANKKHKITKIDWESCKKYFNEECAYCGLHISEHFNLFRGELKWTDFHKEHVDHDGENDLSNCIPSCKRCNNQKHDFDFESWYKNYKYYDEKRFLKIHKWLACDYKKYLDDK